MIILGFCLGLTALLVHGRPEPLVVSRSVSLDQAFSSVGSWAGDDLLGFEERVIETLQVDDYTHRTYTKGIETVWLYVGYYISGGSIGASHSPLVCYPGQGWRIAEKEELVLEPGGHRLRLMSMVAAKGEREDLVLYWFQAYDRTAPGTFRQKLQAMWARTTTGRADSAFVRISVPVGPGGRTEARRTGLSFVDEFYPRFHEYVTGATRER